MIIDMIMYLICCLWGLSGLLGGNNKFLDLFIILL